MNSTMTRDITLMFSVLLSVVSLVFGVYKNVEARNAKSFAYQQAYEVLAIVAQSNMNPYLKAQITDAALASIGTPPPVIDVGRSSADTATVPAVCPQKEVGACIHAASIQDVSRMRECISCFGIKK